MAESKLAGPIYNNYYDLFSVVLVYARPWPHSDIKSCRQSAHVFTSRYDSTLLGLVLFTPKVFLQRYHHFCKDENSIVTQIKQIIVNSQMI